jgi:hypothetical protein
MIRPNCLLRMSMKGWQCVRSNSCFTSFIPVFHDTEKPSEEGLGGRNHVRCSSFQRARRDAWLFYKAYVAIRANLSKREG